MGPPESEHSIQLVATDLDGTLLRSDGTVSSYTRTILKRVAELVPIVFVTARPPRTASVFAREIGVDASVVCCNGALVYDPARGAVITHRPINASDARTIVRSLRDALPGVRFAFELEMTYAWEPGYRELMAAADAEPDGLIGDALDLCARPVTKMIVRHPLHSAEVLAAQFELVVGGRCVATHSTNAFLEISAHGVDKAAAVASICADAGIDRARVVAFGDMRNDIPLLQWAGHGIAVANAHPDVQAAAAERTASNEEDGVARALEKMLLQH